MEREFIDQFRRTQAADPRVPLGVGDDAAVIQLAGTKCVAAVDTITDEVDFLLEECDPQLIGRKALAVNLSDMAAMAATPVAALVSLLLPQQGGMKLAHEITTGLTTLAEQYGVAIAGGDTNSWSGKLAVSVTVLGEPPPTGVLQRNAAQVGQAVLVTGPLGGSILGKHFTFDPRVKEAVVLRSDYHATAAIDVSDGLLIDSSRLARESGLGVVLDLSRIPLAPAANTLARQTGKTPLDHALADGEDFEIVFTTSVDQAQRLLQDQPFPTPITQIGEVIAEPGLWQAKATGPTPLAARGFEHRLE